MKDNYKGDKNANSGVETSLAEGLKSMKVSAKPGASNQSERRRKFKDTKTRRKPKVSYRDEELAATRAIEAVERQEEESHARALSEKLMIGGNVEDTKELFEEPKCTVINTPCPLLKPGDIIGGAEDRQFTFFPAPVKKKSNKKKRNKKY